LYIQKANVTDRQPSDKWANQTFDMARSIPAIHR